MQIPRFSGSLLDAIQHTNGLLRQYFPKGINLSIYTQEQLNEVASKLNGRPRKTLGYDCPADTLNAALQ
jgi:IS30 family transposase